jgi:hypothetical protein
MLLKVRLIIPGFSVALKQELPMQIFILGFWQLYTECSTALFRVNLRKNRQT